jgi:tetratricopeptide (TPR) repeat protein
VAIDRAATIKNAEKLLRQGKVGLAITEYARLVEDQPRDRNLANTLGDLYVRAGEIEQAIEQFTRIADGLAEDGFLPKASAMYKKVLKLKPHDEHALMQAAEIAGRLGTYADARAYLTRIVERRTAQGDTPGAAEARIRLGTIDPADLDARVLAARIRVEIGDSAGATRDLKQIGAALVEKGQAAGAVEVFREAALLAPDDDEIRRLLLNVYIASRDFARARECASTPDELRTLASSLEEAGHAETALETLAVAARLQPEDGELRAHLARAYAARGDMRSAALYVTQESAGSDPQLLLAVAENQLRGDRLEEGLAILRQMIEQSPDRREQVASLGWTIAEEAPETGFKVVQLATDAAIAGQDWASAAAALQEFVTRVPNHIPALTRLVEVCVDGGLEATMSSAQAHLADAYLAAGQAEEARFIAEDLVAREPWDRSNLERFRKSLEMLGDPDPDARIAERLSGQSPFMTTDLSLDGEELPSLDVPEMSHSEPPQPENSIDAAVLSDVLSGPTSECQPNAESSGERTAMAPPQSKATVHDPFELSENAIDLDSILGDFEAPAVAHASSDSVEVDLSIVLNDIDGASVEPSAAPVAAGTDLEGVFARLRDEEARRSTMEDAERQYKRGLELRDEGDIEGSIAALQDASKAPRLRFATASILGRLFRDRGMTHQAVEWLERAAQAPPPSREDGHSLLYDLCAALEQEGEIARALAIALELQADAGDFRDLAARVDRLTKVQAGG